MDWTRDNEVNLALWWLEGLPVNEIARRLKTTHATTRHKAHRMGLPPRENPVKKSIEPKRGDGFSAESRPQGAAVIARTLNVKPPVWQPMPIQRSPVCCFPLWGNEPAPRPPVFCEAPSAPERSYCQTHAAIAYRAVMAASDAA